MPAKPTSPAIVARRAAQAEQARKGLDALGALLEGAGVELRPLVASIAPEGASAHLRLAARCYDDAFWRIEEQRPADSIARARRGVELLLARA